MRKGLLLACCLLAALLFVPSLSQAQVSKTYVGTINNVGQVSVNGSNYTLVYMTPTGASTVRSFVLPTGSANSMTAIALTALSSIKTVTAQVDANGNLIVLYINNS